jgi:uncharacterized protein (TIGR02679 family)
MRRPAKFQIRVLKFEISTRPHYLSPPLSLMPLPDLIRLRATLGQPELSRLVDALQQRLELGRFLVGRLTLSAVTPTERQAADSLLGRVTSRGDSLQIDLDLLALTLREAGICDSLPVAIEALRGKVLDRRARDAELESIWAGIQADAVAALAPWPALVDWSEELFALGLLKRLSTTQPVLAKNLIADLVTIAQALPAQAEPIATFAARLFGDAHALDQGSARATLAVRAAALLGHSRFEDEPESRRTAWASVGILCDELSTPVLVFNLPAQADTPVGRLLRTARSDAEPIHLSLRHLVLWPLSDDPALAGLDIYLCENPTIVALAARRLGPRCAPLVCVNGQFATPAKILLRQFGEAGARLHYHGDFDAGGLHISRRVIGDHGARPWRMSAADYLAAPKGKPIATDAQLASPWDSALAEAMTRERRAVHEEAVADILLQDLAQP